MNRIHFLKITVVAALLTTFTPGCALLQGTMNEGDVALLALDLRDVSYAGTMYALAERPEWRSSIIVVRDQLVNVSAETDLTFDSLLRIMQQLPFEELKSSEAQLAITAGRIVLRRVGRNVDLGNIQNLAPLAKGLADGITDGLTAAG